MFNYVTAENSKSRNTLADAVENARIFMGLAEDASPGISSGFPLRWDRVMHDIDHGRCVLITVEVAGGFRRNAVITRYFEKAADPLYEVVGALVTGENTVEVLTWDEIPFARGCAMYALYPPQDCDIIPT